MEGIRQEILKRTSHWLSERRTGAPINGPDLTVLMCVHCVASNALAAGIINSCHPESLGDGGDSAAVVVLVLRAA